jgi:hypothetical protein
LEVLATTTSAPGTTAPEASRTVPEISAKPCPDAGQTMIVHKSQKTRSLNDTIGFPPVLSAPMDAAGEAQNDSFVG